MTVWDSAVVGKWRNTGITNNTVYRSKPTAYLNKTVPKFIWSPIWHLEIAQEHEFPISY